MKLQENPFVLFMLGRQAYLIIVVIAALGLLSAAGIIDVIPHGLALALMGAAMVLMLFRIIIRVWLFRS